jgi:hypothetical protein
VPTSLADQSRLITFLADEAERARTSGDTARAVLLIEQIYGEADRLERARGGRAPIERNKVSDPGWRQRVMIQ